MIVSDQQWMLKHRVTILIQPLIAAVMSLNLIRNSSLITASSWQVAVSFCLPNLNVINVSVFGFTLILLHINHLYCHGLQLSHKGTYIILPKVFTHLP